MDIKNFDVLYFQRAEREVREWNDSWVILMMEPEAVHMISAHTQHDCKDWQGWRKLWQWIHLSAEVSLWAVEENAQMLTISDLGAQPSSFMNEES